MTNKITTNINPVIQTKCQEQANKLTQQIKDLLKQHKFEEWTVQCGVNIQCVENTFKYYPNIIFTDKTKAIIGLRSPRLKEQPFHSALIEIYKSYNKPIEFSSQKSSLEKINHSPNSPFKSISAKSDTALPRTNSISDENKTTQLNKSKQFTPIIVSKKKQP